MNDSHSSEFAKKRLAAACRTKDTSMRLAWAITLSEALLLGVLAVALIDYWLMLPCLGAVSRGGSLGFARGFWAYRLIRVLSPADPAQGSGARRRSATPGIGMRHLDGGR